MLHFQFINRKRRKIAHENQLSDQFSKSTVIDARLQNAMGLLSLLIALSLQLKWAKMGNNYHFLTEKQKPLLFLKWQVFKIWCSHLKMLAFSVLHCSICETQQYSRIHTEKYRECLLINFSRGSTLSNEDHFIENVSSSYVQLIID